MQRRNKKIQINIINNKGNSSKIDGYLFTYLLFVIYGIKNITQYYILFDI